MLSTTLHRILHKQKWSYDVILLCYTSAFSEVIYADFHAKILDWNFRLVNENSQIFVVVFVSNLNFSFSFRRRKMRNFHRHRFFVTKINLFSSTKIFVFVIAGEKNTGTCVITRSLFSEIYTYICLPCVFVLYDNAVHNFYLFVKLVNQISHK